MSKTDPAIIAFANESFYLAFSQLDLDQMSRLWAEEQPSVCIHPGRQPVFGRQAILESWGQIFDGQSGEMQVVCHGARVISQGDTHSVVCFEELPGGWLVATNNFVMEQGEARLVHHQASHCMEPPVLAPTDRSIQ